MDALNNNLFSRLHKWAHRQDENFLTESLSLVLEHLLTHAPGVGTRLINQLTGGFIDLPADDSGAIAIHTQVETGQGRPDLEISAPHCLAWIEVKSESVLRKGQLEGYRMLLKKVRDSKTRLILLTRYPENYSTDDAHPDFEVRWFEFADWLENEIPAIEAHGEVAAFLAKQFLNFLRVRNMSLTQVGKYMPEGLRALSSLLNMLNEAASACGKSATIAASWDHTGLSLDGRKYWIGVIYTEPEKVWFGTRCRIDREAAVRLGVGQIEEESWVPGRYRWWMDADLDAEDVHFFSRSKVSQMQWLEGFLRDCLNKAHSIESSDQSVIPDNSDEE